MVASKCTNAWKPSKLCHNQQCELWNKEVNQVFYV